MGIADDDDMLAEVRMAHVLQRVHGDGDAPRLSAADAFRLAWEGGARVLGAAGAVGRLDPGRRADLAVLDLDALRAPYADGEADVWELLVARGRSAPVDAVVVDGRVLVRGGVVQHLDRDAVMAELRDAGARAVAGRDGDDLRAIAQIRRRIVEHYRSPAWRA
jgi:5-methylthioadenosine/S-adenosylhomocysteine deaminase